MLPDGTIEGFVGGTCAESTVLAQGLALIDSGESLLLRITPEPEPPQPGKLVVHNACLSGGTLEIFLEPVLPAPRLVVFGDAPVARSLRALATHLGWDVPGADADVVGDVAGIGADVSAVVVASHGRDEEVALTAALAGRGPVRRARRQPQARRGGARVARRRQRSTRAACTLPPGSTSAPGRAARSPCRSWPRSSRSGPDRRGERSPTPRIERAPPPTRCAGCRSPPSIRHSTSTTTTVACGSAAAVACARSPPIPRPIPSPMRRARDRHMTAS